MATGFVLRLFIMLCFRMFEISRNICSFLYGLTLEVARQIPLKKEEKTYVSLFNVFVKFYKKTQTQWVGPYFFYSQQSREENF